LTVPVRVAVNLSTRQFVRNDLAGSVRGILEETGCSPEWLELEITESLLLEDSREAAATLEALHGMGLSISIDDFGTGYSALSYLSRFPVGQLKIDRSFVHDVPAQRDKSELVKAMLSIAAALRLETVAEGVETAEQAAYLTAYGCRLAQGYLFGKPMPLADFTALLAAERAPARDGA
jgi:EAL domain-containing protein (putative c-di-GMP-specific phosphodiesterase class I)